MTDIKAFYSFKGFFQTQGLTQGIQAIVVVFFLSLSLL